MRILRSSFFLMAVLLVVSIGLLDWIGSQVARLTQKGIDAHSVVDQLEDILSTLKDAETGQRGYVLTHKASYLNPYNTATARIGDRLQKLDDLGAKASFDANDRSRLRSLIDQKLTELKRTITLRDEKGFDAALAAVDSDVGEKLMLQIRDSISDMLNKQNAVLAEVQSQTASASQQREVIFLLVGVLNLVFLGWGFNRIQRGIAQRDRALLELGQQKELLAVTLASIGDGVIVCDPSGKITFLNPEAEKLTGWSGAEAIGQNCSRIFDIINEDSRQLVESPVDKVLRSGAVVGLANHTLLIRKDRSELPIDDSGAPIKNADGSIRGVVLVFRDFTEHKIAEQKLKDALALLNAIMDSTQDMIYAKDRNHIMLMANAATLAVIGKTMDQAVGTSDWYRDPEEGSAVQANDRRIMASRVPETVDEVFTGPGGRRLFRATKAPLINDKGEVFGIVAVTRDVTDEKQTALALAAAKEAAEAANIAKDNFLATLSHELRTPLSPVLATLNLWETSSETPASLLPDVQTMRRNVELEARLIDDLLDLTRIVKGKLPLNLETADIHALIESVARMYQSDIHGKQLRLSMSLDAAEHFVRGDPARLQQVFWNILKNATKFTPSGGAIQISSTNVEPGRVQVLFRDTGIGMTAETLSRIFQPFEQASDETLRHFGGLGLGMAISRSLTEAQGGQIAANSQGPGQGATVTVTLTCVAPPSSTTTAPAVQPSKSVHKSLNILLVEDHIDTARAMSRLLRSGGHQVRAAASVAEALHSAEQPFDLLLSDIGLPDGTGVDLVRQIRQLYGSGPAAIALTGFGMEEDITRCREAGFDDHLTKPVNLQNLERVLQRVMDRRK